jgi:membrane protease YdiL (CAAX protease family)
MAAFVAFLAAGIGAGVAGDVARAMGADPAGLSVKAAASMGGAILGIGAAMALVLLMDTRSTHRSGLELSLGRRDVRLGLLALVLAMPVVQATSILSVVLYQVMTGSSPAPIAHETLSALHREPGNPAVWILIAGAVLGAPVLEELVFRIFLQSSILRLTRRPWIAILITSVVFTAAHMGDEAVSAANWHALLSLFVLSVALGHSYEWTRRPAVPILLHMGFNAFNVALVVLGAV